MNAVCMESAVSRASSSGVHGRRPLIVRSVLSPSRGSPVKKLSPKVSTYKTSARCSVNIKQAKQFNYCFINFDKLDEESAFRCVTIADDILAVDAETNICDDNVCTDRTQVNWFKDYMTNAYGF